MITVREVKFWLQQYRRIQREILDIESRITELRLKHGAPSAINYSDMPKAHGAVDLSDYVAKLEEYEQTLIARHTACLGLSVQYMQAFEHLDRDEAHVIKRRYMDAASWHTIATEIPCAERTVYYIHGRALHKLANIPNVCSPLQ